MKRLTCLLAFLIISTTAFAQLEPYTDFDTDMGVSVIATVKVSENMIPHYLEGLSKTWVPAAKYQQQKGYIQSWDVYISDLPESGDFNVILVTRYKDDASVRGNEKQYRDVTDYVRKNILSQEDQDKIVQTSYPNIRKITGEYRIRRVTFKKS